MPQVAKRSMFGAAAVALGLLTACGTAERQDDQYPDSNMARPSQPAEPGHAASTAASATPEAFAVCETCHSVEPGKNQIGPSLHGVVGRKAGTEAGFTYSPAMQQSGLTWNEATLDRYLENPYVVVPGTKMPFAGLKEKPKREAVITYLKTLK